MDYSLLESMTLKRESRFPCDSSWSQFVEHQPRVSASPRIHRTIEAQKKTSQIYWLAESCTRVDLILRSSPVQTGRYSHWRHHLPGRR